MVVPLTRLFLTLLSCVFKFSMQSVPLRVGVRRPPSGMRGGLYEVNARPPTPVKLGMRVSLHLPYIVRTSGGLYVHPSMTRPTGIQGVVMGIEALRTDAIEFLLCDECFGNSYEYLLVNTLFPGFVEIPEPLYLGYVLLKHSLVSTAVGLARGDPRAEGGWCYTVTKPKSSISDLSRVGVSCMYVGLVSCGGAIHRVVSWQGGGRYCVEDQVEECWYLRQVRLLPWINSCPLRRLTITTQVSWHSSPHDGPRKSPQASRSR